MAPHLLHGNAESGSYRDKASTAAVTQASKSRWLATTDNHVCTTRLTVLSPMLNVALAVDQTSPRPHNVIKHQLPRFSRLAYTRFPGRVQPFAPTNELIWHSNGVSCTHISEAHGQCTLYTCFREGRTSTSCRLRIWPEVHDRPHGTVFLQA